MTNSEKLKILKQAKKLFVEHPEYWGMCFALNMLWLELKEVLLYMTNVI